MKNIDMTGIITDPTIKDITRNIMKNSNYKLENTCRHRKTGDAQAMQNPEQKLSRKKIEIKKVPKAYLKTN